MGLGIFAGIDIPAYSVLDEYFGELIPPAEADKRNDDYCFEIPGVAHSAAQDYGNWTRFVNHCCESYNVEAVDDVIGGRRTITFKSLEAIPSGTQLFIDYGTKYFGDPGNMLMCNCPDYPGLHLPPGQDDSTSGNSQAFPGPPVGDTIVVAPDMGVSARNTWITDTKSWLNQREPGGYPHWTALHWRFLEQLMRRRRHFNRNDWSNKYGYGSLSPSRSDPLVGKYVTHSRASMQIREWHIDVIKVFQHDNVCGTKKGVRWEKKELLGRLFALIIADRRRSRRAGLDNRRARSMTPPDPAPPVPGTPAGARPQAGVLPTPPATVRPQATSIPQAAA